MPCSCRKPATQPENQPDRYVSFKDIDCDGNAKQLMRYIHRHIDEPDKTNAFWEYFKKKAAGETGPQPDDLFMIHCHLNQIRELFETYNDTEALTLLDWVEVECC